MKTLFVDIETAPNLAYVWGIWQQNISLNHMVNSSYILCWSAKWQGNREIYFDSVHASKPRRMLWGIHRLLDEADVVVSYNGKSFDVPTLQKEFLMHDMYPPKPYKQVDMLLQSRRNFRFQSNKLDYVCQQLGIGEKTEHKGFQLWVDCMANDPKAWGKMEEYNKNDVVLLEKLHDRMLPWIKNYPNRNTYSKKDGCSHCGGVHVQSRGTAVIRECRYKQYQCMDCGTWLYGEKVKGKPWLRSA